MTDANESAESASGPPSSIRVATGVWLALAAFGVVTALLSWTQQDELRRILASQPGMPPGAVEPTLRSWLLQNTAVQVLFGVVYAVLGWLLRSGRAWTRWALTVAAPLHLLLVVLGGVSAGAVIVLLLAVGGLVLSWLRASSAYLAREQS